MSSKKVDPKVSFPKMGQRLHILEASGRLTPLVEEITLAVERVIGKIGSTLLLPPVDIVIVDNPEGSIPETGVGGRAYNAHFLVISVDPEFTRIHDVIGEEIESTLAHELHHCARMDAIGYGETLLEALVTEGLADHFDIEINGGMPKPWSNALSKGQVEDLLKKAAPEYRKRSYSHESWFFGSEEMGIPRWTGYSLGFKIVSDYLMKTGKKPSELVGIPASEFVKTQRPSTLNE